MIEEHELQQILEEAHAKVRVGLMEDVKGQIMAGVRNGLTGKIQKIVDDFVEKDLAPDIRNQLVENKPAILEAAVRMANETTDVLTRAMVANLQKKLENRWEVTKILKAIFE